MNNNSYNLIQTFSSQNGISFLIDIFIILRYVTTGDIIKM